MYLIIYNKYSGDVLAKVSSSQTFEGYCREFPEGEFHKLEGIYVDNVPINHKDYRIVDGEFIKKTETNEPNIPINPLEDRIKELENIIDIMLGGIDDGI